MKLLFVAIMLCGMSFAHAAADRLWIGQVEGTAMGDIDKSLNTYRTLFQAQFQLSGLRLLDTEKELLEPGQSSLATFKGGYSMNVTCLRREVTRYVVSLILADRVGPVLEAQVEIARDSPIILAGPASTEGRPFFVIDVR